MLCILWISSSSIIKTFGLLIVFVIATNAIGYVLFESDQGSGLIIVLDCVIYIVAVFILAKMSGGNLLDLTKRSETINTFLKIISVCILFGFVNGIVEKYAYEENESDIKPYLIDSCLKSYSINATILLVIYIYMLSSMVESFSMMLNGF